MAPLAFPWAGETPRRVTIECDKAELIAAYVREQRRFDVRMAKFRRADIDVT